MAAPTLTNVPVTISSADSVTGWVGEGGLEPDIKLEGTNSVFATLRQDASSVEYTAANFAGANQHIRGWVQFTALGNLDFFEMLIGGNNTAFWNIFRGAASAVTGIPTYQGGWFNAIVDYNSTNDSGTKPTGNITDVGFRFQRIGQPRNVTNTFVDYLRYGDGYTLTGGTVGDPITFTETSTVDSASAYGIILSEQEVNFCFGKITIGSGATATYFKADSDVFIFADAPVNASLYDIIGQGSGCTVDIANSVIKGAGDTDTTRFDFTMSNADVTLLLAGTTFVRAGVITLKSGQTASNCIFNDCSSILGNGADFTGSRFSDAPSTEAVVVSNLDQVDLCDFTKGATTSHAVELTSIGTGDMDWSCTTSEYVPGATGSPASTSSTGNESIFVNVNTGSLDINVVAGATLPSIRTAGATVNVVAGQATLTVSGVISNSDVVIYTAGTTTKLQDDQDITGTTSTYTYTFSAGTFVDIKVYRDGYVPFFVYGFELGSTSATLPVAQQIDRNYVP